MRIKKYTAAAVLAISATAITAGTANAQPAQIQPATMPVVHGAGFTATPAADGKSLVTTLDAGTFQLSADQTVVHVVNATGGVIMTLPTGAQIGNQRVMAHPIIDHNGTRLTLTRIGGTQDVALQDINSQQWFFSELQHAALGALIGAIVGLLFFGMFPVGALIGLLIAGGQPLIDSGIAYFTGQP